MNLLSSLLLLIVFAATNRFTFQQHCQLLNLTAKTCIKFMTYSFALLIHLNLLHRTSSQCFTLSLRRKQPQFFSFFIGQRVAVANLHEKNKNKVQKLLIENQDMNFLFLKNSFDRRPRGNKSVLISHEIRPFIFYTR